MEASLGYNKEPDSNKTPYVGHGESNSSTWKAETGGLPQISGQPRLVIIRSVRTIYQDHKKYIYFTIPYLITSSQLYRKISLLILSALLPGTVFHLPDFSLHPPFFCFSRWCNNWPQPRHQLLSAGTKGDHHSLAFPPHLFFETGSFYVSLFGLELKLYRSS